ncbi:hypothetical protein KW800_02590 [Candidatus Parcubacteria bacterium]|nr:hypothetical protein [Candidatus Parcubacteria bacterium]
MFNQLAATGILQAIQATNTIISRAIPLTVALALLAFLFGLMKFVFKAGDESAQEEGKRVMLWGIIALFVMVAVWGLVKFVAESLGIGTGGTVSGIIQVPISK